MENYPAPLNLFPLDTNNKKDAKSVPSKLSYSTGRSSASSTGRSSASSTETLKPEEVYQENLMVGHLSVENVGYPRSRMKSGEEGYFSHDHSDFARTKPTAHTEEQPTENLHEASKSTTQLSRVDSDISIVSVDITSSARSPVPHKFVTSGSLQTLGGRSFTSSGEILGSRSSLNKRSIRGKFFFT